MWRLLEHSVISRFVRSRGACRRIVAGSSVVRGCSDTTRLARKENRISALSNGTLHGSRGLFFIYAGQNGVGDRSACKEMLKRPAKGCDLSVRNRGAGLQGRVAGPGCRTEMVSRNGGPKWWAAVKGLRQGGGPIGMAYGIFGDFLRQRRFPGRDIIGVVGIVSHRTQQGFIPGTGRDITT